MKKEIKKIREHTNLLLGYFIQLKEKFAILKPMVFSKKTVQQFGSEKRGRGFLILREDLLLTCTQEISKLTFDRSEKAPSIVNLVTKLEKPSVVIRLKKDFIDAARKPSKQLNPTDKTFEQLFIDRRVQEQEMKFDELLLEVHSAWKEIESCETFQALKKIRDKVTAHNETRFKDGKYSKVEISEFGLKWGDLETKILQLQEQIERINIIVRNASFAWEMLDEQLASASSDFWSKQTKA